MTTDADPLAALDSLKPEDRDLGPQPNPAALEFLLTRRSTPAKTLTAPGPSEAALQRMLIAAARVPDHKKLEPWRFIVIGDETRARLIEAIGDRGVVLNLDDEAIKKAQRGMADAPTLVAVVFSPKPSDGAPEIEQLLSTGAAAAALVNAALASGYGANWLSGWAAHDATLMQDALGVSPDEKLAAFIHIGTPKASPPERPRPDLSKIVSRLP